MHVCCVVALQFTVQNVCKIPESQVVCQQELISTQTSFSRTSFSPGQPILILSLRSLLLMQL